MFTRYRTRITRARDPGGPGQTVRTEQTGEEPRLLRTNVSCIAALCAGFVVGYRWRRNVEKLAKKDRFCKKKNFVRKGACYSICIYICVSFYKIKIRNLGLCLGITVAFKIFCVNNTFTRSSVKHNLSYSVGYKRKIEIVQNHKFLFISFYSCTYLIQHVIQSNTIFFYLYYLVVTT